MANRKHIARARLKYRNHVQQCRLRALIRTQTELSQLTGLDIQTINRLENGKKFLGAAHALIIADALHCSVDALYGRTAPTGVTEFQGGAPILESVAVT